MSAPTWSSTPANAETNKALRVAAAHVCGMIPSRNDRYLCEQTGRAMLTYRNWHPQRDRNQLARVFAAALLEIDEDEDKAVVYQNYWIDALDDPRAALAALLDLLGVPVPEEATK